MRAVVAGDFTGDGKADAYAIQNSAAPYLYTGKGDGTSDGASQTGQGWQGWQGMRLVSGGDFNGDGRTDIIAINDNRGIYAYPGKAAGALGTPVVTPPRPTDPSGQPTAPAPVRRGRVSQSGPGRAPEDARARLRPDLLRTTRAGHPHPGTPALLTGPLAHSVPRAPTAATATLAAASRPSPVDRPSVRPS